MTQVQTALGAVAATQLGPTLTHEHLFVNLMLERRGDGLLNDEALMAGELAVFGAQGGGTIFELTTAELTVGTAQDEDPAFTAAVAGQTRSPASVQAIQRLSERCGVNVVLGAGRYRDPYLSEAAVDRVGVDALADEMVRDLDHGFPGTDVRAGLIGEVGADKWYVSAREERVLRAAARAHLRTGAPVYTHAARWPVGHQQLALLREEGVDPARVAVGHADTVPDPEYAVEIARTGAYVGLDTINNAGRATTDRVLVLVRRLLDAGLGQKILLSHDVCLATHLRANGGNGFGFVLGGLRDLLVDAGVSLDQFTDVVVGNPRRFLTGTT